MTASFLPAVFSSARSAGPWRRLALALALAALTLPSATAAVHDEPTADEVEEAEYVRANYTKYEYRIPMRDGAHLFTAVYVPNRLSEETFPILLHRTPYDVGPYGVDAYRDGLGRDIEWAREGFIFAFQDVRGRYLSEGEFVDMRPQIPEKGDTDTDESTDAWDTIDWLVKNVPRNSGKVGLWGTSYPGFYSSAGMIDSHPALVAVSPQAPIADWFIGDDMHRHGAFVLALTFNFFSEFGQARPEPTTEQAQEFDHRTPDGYQFFLDMGPLPMADEKHLEGKIAFWDEVMQHPNYDEFWQSRNLLPHLKGVKAAVMTVGGWYDTEDLYGPLATYRAVEQQNPGIFNMLVMGPWSHGAWSRKGRSLGTADFGFDTSAWYREQVELPFFRHFLKGGPRPALPEALVFETGANRWRTFDAWPPREAKREQIFLHPGGRLATVVPEGGDPLAHDAYVSDPARPVPYTAGVALGWSREYMTEDQRFAARRPDVLVYQTEPLTENLTVAGPITADLWVSTSGEDTDWIVKVIDVWPGEVPNWDEESGGPDPGGRQELVRAEVFRSRFRESYEHPKPMVPGEPTDVPFELRDILHTFKAGHRLMVQVQSTWFPYIDRNPGTWVPSIYEAKEEDFQAVTNRVYHAAPHASHLIVRILDGRVPPLSPEAAPAAGDQGAEPPPEEGDAAASAPRPPAKPAPSGG